MIDDYVPPPSGPLTDAEKMAAAAIRTLLLGVHGTRRSEVLYETGICTDCGGDRLVRGVIAPCFCTCDD